MLRHFFLWRAKAPSRYQFINRPRIPGTSNPLVKEEILEKSMYIVAVPIGNVKDFTIRGLEILRRVDYIACANRQMTASLLEHIDISHKGRLIQYAQFNRAKLAEFIRGGASVAFVATQGMPGVGEIGNEVVRDMQALGVKVTICPGVDAVTTALALSGAANDGLTEAQAQDHARTKKLFHVSCSGSFVFAGRINHTSGRALWQQLQEAYMSDKPTIFFDTPQQFLRTLAACEKMMPKRRIAVMHEMTKMYESVHADQATRLFNFYQDRSLSSLLTKGQLTFVVDPRAPDDIDLQTGTIRGHRKHDRHDRDSQDFTLHDQEQITFEPAFVTSIADVDSARDSGPCTDGVGQNEIENQPSDKEQELDAWNIVHDIEDINSSSQTRSSNDNNLSYIHKSWTTTENSEPSASHQSKRPSAGKMNQKHIKKIKNMARKRFKRRKHNEHKSTKSFSCGGLRNPEINGNK